VTDYCAEAATYDASRGGEARAAATAEAIERLLPAGARTLVDVACGTGIVTRRLRHPARAVLGLDRSPGMLELAAGRLPDAAPVLAEGAQVLRDGGVLVTTVDKDEAAFSVESDIAEVLAPDLLRRNRPGPKPAPVAGGNH
jgi:hypothetical protein